MISVNVGGEGLGRLLFQNSLLSAEAGTVTIPRGERQTPPVGGVWLVFAGGQQQSIAAVVDTKAIVDRVLLIN